MTNQVAVGKKYTQLNNWQDGYNNFDSGYRTFPYLNDEDFADNANSWHWLKETEIEVGEKKIDFIQKDWKEIKRTEYFNTKDIPQWTSELENIQSQYEAKMVEVERPASYWFWNK
jgi:hypothetical protein